MFIAVKVIDKYVAPKTTTAQKKSDLSCLCGEQPHQRFGKTTCDMSKKRVIGVSRWLTLARVN